VALLKLHLVGCQGVELDNGHIKVDEFQNTSASGVYALGDVAGKALLTPGICLCLLTLNILNTNTCTVILKFSWWFPKALKDTFRDRWNSMLTSWMDVHIDT